MKGAIHWILDNGHGAINPATFQPVTPGKRGPEFPKGHEFEGKVLIEGVRNRKVVEYLSKMLEKEGFVFTNLVNTWEDVPLKRRTDQANKIAAASSIPCVYLSIHHDAHQYQYLDPEFKTIYDPRKHGKKSKDELFRKPYLEFTTGNGCGSFAYSETSRSFPLAKVFAETIPAATGLKARGTKARSFWVLRKTSCLAVLTENGFMTNLKDASFAMSEAGSRKIAEGHFNAIKQIEENFEKYFKK